MDGSSSSSLLPSSLDLSDRKVYEPFIRALNGVLDASEVVRLHGPLRSKANNSQDFRDFYLTVKALPFFEGEVTNVVPHEALKSIASEQVDFSEGCVVLFFFRINPQPLQK